MNTFHNRALELYDNTTQNITEISRIIKKEFPSNDQEPEALRMQISRLIKKRGLRDACESLNIDQSTVPYMWLKSKEASLFIRNPNFNVTEINFDKIISECMADHVPVKKIKAPKSYDFDRVIWTDVHVGMDASRKGLALYPADWNPVVLNNRIDEMIDFILENKTSDILILDELGDYMDGWDGETTRKGHKLPQNMTNEESFEAGLEAKVRLIDELSKHYKHITCNNICEDNHAGAFGYIVNSAFKQIVDFKHSNVEVINHQKFINFYIIGDHGFIISHGKDSRNLKFGFKPQLDPRSSEKISQYIRHNNELRSCKYIEFSKGDSHQCLFDMCTSDEFDYFNYPAFSPSSEWVQTNFKKGRSGFVVQNISKFSDRKNIKPYFFE